MEFHRVTRPALAHPKTPDEAVDQTVHIITTIRKEEGTDASPLQLISAELLVYLRRCEVELAEMKARAEEPNTTKSPPAQNQGNPKI